MNKYQRILIIQTAFIGDVILATGLVEKLAASYPDSKIDFLLRKGNEPLLLNNPHINEVLVFEKSSGKYLNLYGVIKQVRKRNYDLLINVQRFLTTSVITRFSKAKERVGFRKSPLGIAYSKRVKHNITPGVHEIERNHDLIRHITDEEPGKPALYPSSGDLRSVERFKVEPYVTISPASVWFTKQYPADKWVSFLDRLKETNVFILGSKQDRILAERIIGASSNDRIGNLAGDLSLLQSAALMQGARMNYTNDSAPMHLASAVNAPVTAIYCSTVPDFGFGPLSDNSHIIETSELLKCRPCGLHGKKECPQRHFNCAKTIKDEQLFAALELHPPG